MPRVAQLHNGVQMHVPDEVDDQTMDAMAKGAISGLQPQGDPTALIGQVISAVAQSQAKQQQDDAVRMQSSAMETQQKAAALASVSDAVASLAQPIAAIAQGANTDQLVMAVNNLSATIVEAVHALITVLNAPQSINVDENGIPNSIGRAGGNVV